MLVELDGIPDVVEGQVATARAACLEHGALEVRMAREAKERELLWKGRKGAIGALGRIAPNYYILDGVVPRSKLVSVMGRVAEIGALRLPSGERVPCGRREPAPNLLFDDRVPGRASACWRQVQKSCGPALTPAVR